MIEFNKTYTAHDMIELALANPEKYQELENLLVEVEKNFIHPNSQEAQDFAIKLAEWDGGSVWGIGDFPDEAGKREFIGNTIAMDDPSGWEGMEEFPEECGKVVGAMNFYILYKLPNGKYIFSEIPA